MKTPSSPEQSLLAVLKTYKDGNSAEISPQLLDVCVRVHDQLEMAAKEECLTAQQGDLLESMTGFIRSSPSIEALIEIAMAIVYDVGRAQGRSGIVMDLARARGVSRQHADRQIKRGRVILVFQRAGKRLKMPTGRKVELLGNLPPEHWIPCWEFVIERAEKKGKVSDKDAESSMEIYKYQNRMEPQALELVPPDTTVIELNPETVEEPVSQKPAGKNGKPFNNLSSEMTCRLFELLSNKAKRSLASSLRRGNPIKVALGVFSRIAGKKTSEKSAQVGELLDALRENDFDYVQRIEERARMLLLEEFSRKVEQYCDQLKKAGKAYCTRHPKPER